MARVEAAMLLVLANVESLKAELATLDDDPGSGQAATADAVVEWQEAVSSEASPHNAR
jgi:hypothetical protein